MRRYRPAGRILDREGGPLALERFETAVRVNLVGSFNLLRLAAARMVQRPRCRLRGCRLRRCRLRGWRGFQ
ncbi:MAG: hypothetical protein NVSMB32_01490 [Actinomycetota bacterium]